MNRSTFTKELKPWVIGKIAKEDGYIKMQEKAAHMESCYGLYTATETDDFYKDEVDLQKNSVISSGVFDTSSEQQSSMPQDMLINSALSAVCENVEDDVGWYAESNSMRKDTDEYKMCYSREISRSDSSIYQEPIEITSKSLKNCDRQDSFDETKTASLQRSMPTYPRSSTNVSMLKKGHYRSKSDQLGGYGLFDKVDRLELGIPGASSSLPKQIGEFLLKE